MRTTISQQEWLDSLEQCVEQHIQKAIDFQNMDDAVLNKPASDGGWSVAQCLAHLNSYGQYYLPYLKSGLGGQSGKRGAAVFKSSWLGNYLTRLMNPNLSKRKFKAAQRHQPTAYLSAQQVVAEFIDQQEALLVLLKKAALADLSQGRIPTSVMPWIRLSLGDVLQFVIVHNERHIAQAGRVLSGCTASSFRK
ncbi:DinB family protein [Spirosoma montaniterrae]|uniref:DinB-like domain-containing protein n=1 Tax=Spirosoma montaniterrae TaxID=1178516 RepID=A0A1P9WSG6_9BACT|nr:DinB family protein [Spirosoma montaniterrae]AQG78331.1 hypothetical protein AWR27_02645 [Spirosoma montaniterrae]